MKSKKRLLDLKKHGKRPLILKREERSQNNILTLERKGRSRQFAFDLKKKRVKEQSGIYITEPQTGKKLPRLMIAVVAFTIVLLLNFVGVFGSGKQTVERMVNTAFKGVESLTAAGNAFAAGDFLQSHKQFSVALTAFSGAEKNFLTLSGAGAVLATKPESVQAGSKLVTAGRLIARSGEKFALAADRLATAATTWESRQKLVVAGQEVSSFSLELTGIINGVIAGMAELESAQTILALVDVSSLPGNLQTKVSEARERLKLFLNITKPYLAVLPKLPELLGDKIPRRYLILFQNPDEIRPTGGFIGSVAIVTLNDGFVQKFELKDVYEIDGQITKKIDPPEGFGIITDRWGLRDSNYHPDFPTSAATASWLFEEAGYGTVDGVVAITSNLLTRIVKEIGGVTLPRFGQVPAKDLNLLLSLVIETKLDGAAAPKQILSEVWQQLLAAIPELPKGKLVDLVREAIAAGEVQAYIDHPDFAGVVKAFGIDGALIKTESDYLFVVDTSLSGNKSDRYTRNKILHETKIQPDGTAIDRLKITRSHGWGTTKEKRLTEIAQKYKIPLSEKMKDLLGRGRNVDLIKVFVPMGSKLITVNGIPSDRVETHESAGKTYFMLSLTTQPGSEREVVLTYRVLGNFLTNYSLTTQQQVGVHPTDFTKIIRQSGKEIYRKREMVTEDRVWKIGT